MNVGRVVDLDSIPAGVAAAFVDTPSKELQPHDGEGIVDDKDEEENAEEAGSQGHHGVHQVSVPTLQANQSVDIKDRAMALL